ncbi:unnamed protein product, partial [Ectocarpus fasciculatus]
MVAAAAGEVRKPASQFGGPSLMASKKAGTSNVRASKPKEKAGTGNGNRGGDSPPRTPSRSLFSLPESSSDEDEEAFQRRYFGLPPLRKSSAAAAAASVPPPTAEAKVARPGSDGGWPETKRCSPPNLKASLISKQANGGGAACRKTTTSEDGRGYRRGGDSANGS